MLTNTKVKLVVLLVCIAICSIAITPLLINSKDQIEDTGKDPTASWVQSQLTTTVQWDYQWIDNYNTEKPIELNGVDYFDNYYDGIWSAIFCPNCVYDDPGTTPHWNSPCQGMEYNATLHLFCIYPTWVNDGFCDEECNNPDFNYDGGDCCLDIVDNAKCIDCYCYQDCSIHPLKFNHDEEFKTESECYEPQDLDPEDCMVLWLNDGVCDDGCNNHLFDYDQQDCCLEDVLTHYCEECICYANCTTAKITASECPGMGYNESLYSTVYNLYSYCADSWIGDGICDDECNYFDPLWDHDGGDCCLDIVNNAKCIDCYCYEDCSVHSFRFIDGEDLNPQTEPDCYQESDHDFDWDDCPFNWLGDGICDDTCNNHHFDFDLQDCCLGSYESNYNCLTCICYANCTKAPFYLFAFLFDSEAPTDGSNPLYP